LTIRLILIKNCNRFLFSLKPASNPDKYSTDVRSLLYFIVISYLEGCSLVKEQYINEILNKLMNEELSEYYVKNEDFMEFRQVLVKRIDFKHFRGIAQRSGDVLYKYLKEPRS
jgi:hypothetical protein